MTKELINREMIDLQHSHVTQSLTGHKKSPWSVQQNITNKELAQLPAHLTDDVVFAIMRFAKKYELLAFNRGIEFGKDVQMAVYQPLIDQLNKKIKLGREENERLAEALDRLTKKEV